MSAARDRVLGRLRASLERREAVEHPGAVPDPRPDRFPDALRGFETTLARAGGETVRVPDEEAAAKWLGTLRGPRSKVVGTGVPISVLPPLPDAPADRADLAISMAHMAIADTGTLVLFSSDGRRAQLLAPTHVVLVAADRIHATLSRALGEIRGKLPSAVGLHSGPSKSADIGQVMVRGVHGPGRLIAVIIGGPS